TYYIQAGRFTRKPLAYELAAILSEKVAPASVETTRSGSSLIHLIRVGPFRGDNEAQVTVARLRAAGLRDAYVERFSGS
ncbi:MAG TPA: SPOR domain-containing protein, partial [Hyphomicrobiales bacterium]|nr:SPOR domain-containing protein [Hyphomicrobiales bacterium]